ncbi:hypothetical protein BS78_06G088700 [Paspalum vaginatum]|nr:hypothetical protein BS78_06G088700 [Paspalum vaginatum]
MPSPSNPLFSTSPSQSHPTHVLSPFPIYSVPGFRRLEAPKISRDDLLFSVAFSSPPDSGSSSPSGGLGFCDSICLHIHSPPVFLWHLFGRGCLVRGTGPALGLLAARHLSLRQSCLSAYGSTRLPA